MILENTLSKDRRAAVSDRNQDANDSMLKSTLVLTTLLFLLLAPAPDSRDIAEMTANFLVPSNHSTLMASNTPIQPAQVKYRR